MGKFKVEKLKNGMIVIDDGQIYIQSYPQYLGYEIFQSLYSGSWVLKINKYREFIFSNRDEAYDAMRIINEVLSEDKIFND